MSRFAWESCLGKDRQRPQERHLRLRFPGACGQRYGCGRVRCHTQIREDTWRQLGQSRDLRVSGSCLRAYNKDLKCTQPELDPTQPVAESRLTIKLQQKKLSLRSSRSRILICSLSCAQAHSSSVVKSFGTSCGEMSAAAAKRINDDDNAANLLTLPCPTLAFRWRWAAD